MTSFVAKQPADRLILSNAIRAGILGLTKTLSNELAENGILVNAICPGWTLTKRVEELARSTAKDTGKNLDYRSDNDNIRDFNRGNPDRRNLTSC